MSMMIHRRKMRVAKQATLYAPVENTVEKKVEEVSDVVASNSTTLTKTEINRMSKEDLITLAKTNGINPEASGVEIKKALCEKFGL